MSLRFRATGKLKRRIRVDRGCLSAVGFAPDGKTLATGDRKGVVTFWETATWKTQATLRPSPSVTGSFVQNPCLAFSAEGKWLVAGGGVPLRV